MVVALDGLEAWVSGGDVCYDPIEVSGTCATGCVDDVSQIHESLCAIKCVMCGAGGMGVHGRGHVDFGVANEDAKRRTLRRHPPDVGPIRTLKLIVPALALQVASVLTSSTYRD